jgi:hypothetical protein
MLSSRHFYHRTTRKLVVAFGTMFNNLKLYRYTKDGDTEIERVTVPLTYANKEKYYTRITQDPNLAKQTLIDLPRMAFEMVSITYDPLRKISNYNELFSPGQDGNKITTVRAAPYNFAFDLNIYVRNVEDGSQLIEQILPYFTPDYTLALNLTGIQNDIVNVPIVLESISYENRVDSDKESTRVIVWNLTFTVQAFLYGYINDDIKIIRKAIANTFDSTSLQKKEQILTLGSGSGEYKIGELVFVGTKLSTANASGFVGNWSNTSKQLFVTDIAGALKTNTKIIGAVSNASYTISSFADTDNKIMNLQVTPNPSNASPNNAFGFDESITYYPNIT